MCGGRILGDGIVGWGDGIFGFEVFSVDGGDLWVVCLLMIMGLCYV